MGSVNTFFEKTLEKLNNCQNFAYLNVDGIIGCNTWRSLQENVIGTGRTATTID